MGTKPVPFLSLKRAYIISFLVLCLVYVSHSQQSLSSFVKELSSTTDKSFFYKNEWIDSIQVVDRTDDFIHDIRESLKRSGFKVYVHQDRYVFIYPNKLEFERIRQSNQFNRIGQSYSAVRIGNPATSDPDAQYVLEGIVTEEAGDPIAGATVLAQPGGQGSVTNAQGKFRMTLSPGNYRILFQYLGLENEVRNLTLYGSGQLNVALYESGQFLEEVVVEGIGPEAQLKEPVIGKTKIDIGTIESMPTFLGEVDVMKSATMLPGVNVTGESSSYLNIRGGRNDQTLILMNKAPVFNPGHLLGFFSVFNGDFVSDLSLYKGNIPARYGTRASSVLDVSLGRWATKKWNVYGGVGLVNSNLGFKGKFLEDKLDVHVGGRGSYSDWMFDLVPNEDILKSSAWFRDGNLIARYVSDQSNTFNLSAYSSSDYFKYSDKVIYRLQAINGSLEWNHLFKNGWVATSTVIFSKQDNGAEGLEVGEEYMLENGLVTYAFQQELSLDVGPGEMVAGAEINRYEINPGEIDPTGSSRIVAETLEREYLQTFNVFSEYKIQLLDHLTINPGLRYVLFQNNGPGTTTIYESNRPLEEEFVVGTREFESGETKATYARLEPRIGLNYSWGNHSIKAGYSRTNQFLHLVANTALINPISIWKGSDAFIQPTQIDQYSVGYQVNLKNSTSFSVEGYYKAMDNLVDYKDGADLVLNDHLEQVIIGGKGTSYGVEFSLNKTEGDFKGWMSYTYSRAFIETDGDFPSEVINDGEKYPYYSDRPHNIQVNANYQLTRKWSVSANFTFSSGAPTSAPSHVFQIDGINVPYFPERNAVRIPDYHRLDLALTLKSRIRKTKKNNDRWVLSFYNVYARDNASTVFFARNDDRPAQPFQLISIGSIIPTLTYKFEI